MVFLQRSPALTGCVFPLGWGMWPVVPPLFVMSLRERKRISASQTFVHKGDFPPFVVLTIRTQNIG